MEKLLIIVPGFGGNKNEIELKRKLIWENLKLIRKTYKGEIDVEVFCYSDVSLGVKIDCVNIKETLEKGVIGQFIYKYIKHEIVNNYNNVIVMLDDIQLDNNTNLSELIHIQKKYNVDIISPSLTCDSQYTYRFMLKDSHNMIRDVNFIELFFNLFTKNSFIKWLNLLDGNTSWLWGIDKSLYFNNFKMFIIDTIPIKHYLKGNSYNISLPNPQQEYLLNFKRCTKYKNLQNFKDLEILMGEINYIFEKVNTGCMVKFIHFNEHI